MAATPSLIHGKLFEKDVNDVMSKLFLQYPVHWRRILDSAAAGNLIEATEGDFELIAPLPERGHSMGFVIECKASINHTTFATGFRSLIKPKQLGKMRLRIRGGFFGVYLFYSVENEEIEVWSAAPIIEAYSEKRSKFYCQPAVVVSKPNFKRLAEDWVRFPQKFLEKLIRSETIPVGVS